MKRRTIKKRKSRKSKSLSRTLKIRALRQEYYRLYGVSMPNAREYMNAVDRAAQATGETTSYRGEITRRRKGKRRRDGTGPYPRSK